MKIRIKSREELYEYFVSLENGGAEYYIKNPDGSKIFYNNSMFNRIFTVESETRDYYNIDYGWVVYKNHCVIITELPDNLFKV